MIPSILLDHFLHEIQKLEDEIKLFDNEAGLWTTQGTITNPAGNLCLHLCGNLQHFIGAVLGKSGYERNRQEEFARKNVTRAELLEEIKKTHAVVESTLRNLHEEDLVGHYPVHVFGKEVNTIWFLIHLLGHFDYHLGQINYLRRM